MQIHSDVGEAIGPSTFMLQDGCNSNEIPMLDHFPLEEHLEVFRFKTAREHVDKDLRTT